MKSEVVVTFKDGSEETLILRWPEFLLMWRTGMVGARPVAQVVSGGKRIIFG